MMKSIGSEDIEILSFTKKTYYFASLNVLTNYQILYLPPKIFTLTAYYRKFLNVRVVTFSIGMYGISGFENSFLKK